MALKNVALSKVPDDLWKQAREVAMMIEADMPSVLRQALIEYVDEFCPLDELHNVPPDWSPKPVDLGDAQDVLAVRRWLQI